MKNAILPLLLGLALTATPILAQGLDMGSVTPTLDFPAPAPQPVSQNNSGISK